MGLVFIGAAAAAFIGGRRYRVLNWVGIGIVAVYVALILLSLSAGVSVGPA